MELDPHIDKKIYWEHKMMELLNRDNADGNTVHFEYSTTTAIDQIFKLSETATGKPGSHILKVKTYNPKKEIMFLLVEVKGTSPGECIESAYEELIHMRNQKGYSSYTLDWRKINDQVSQKSFFYAKNEFEVLTKFYSDKGPENVVFESLRLNPMS